MHQILPIGTKILFWTDKKCERTDGMDRRTDALTVGYLLCTYSVRKSSQAQQIPDNFYGINLILSKLAPFICGLFRN